MSLPSKEQLLTPEQGAAYRLVEACMREEKRLEIELSPSTVKWIFTGCGLWEALNSLGEILRKANG